MKHRTGELIDTPVHNGLPEETSGTLMETLRYEGMEQISHEREIERKENAHLAADGRGFIHGNSRAKESRAYFLTVRFALISKRFSILGNGRKLPS